MLRFSSSGRETLVHQYERKMEDTKQEQKELDQERESLEENKSELQEKLSKAEVSSNA